ncbi:hypothetical protein, partial [Marivita sp.]|uniref:hypothetical protein n=1 Tax=Marivita sp. TaxID=2003365 RepID=UPI002634B9B0
SAQNQALGASEQPILALRAQNRFLSAQSKPDCTEIGAAKTVNQTFLSKSTIQLVRASRVRYLNSSFKHPSDMMIWIDPNNSDFLWKSWGDEIKLAADFATQ